MRRLAVAVIVAFATLPAFAQVDTAPEIRFVPPAPDSRTPVTARISGVWQDSGFPRCGNVAVAGHEILITLGCRPDVVLPAVMRWSLDVPIGTLAAGVYDVEVRLPDAPPPLPETFTARLTVQDGAASFDVLPNIRSGLSQRIILKGSALRCSDAAQCVAPIVRFGGEQVVIVRATGDEIEVEAPPGGSGTVDVTVQFGSQTLRRVAAFHFPDLTGTPAPEFFTPVLFPVLFSANGAFGSLWDTEVSVANAAPYELSTPHGSIFDGGCDLCDPPGPHRIPSGGTHVIRARNFNLTADRGYLFYVSRAAAADLHFGLLVRDLSRQAEALGTEIPVVREEDLHDRPFSLLNVPIDSRFRVALRIYSIYDAARVGLRITNMVSDEVLVNTTVATAGSGIFRQEHGSLAIIDLVAAYPQLAGKGPLRIEIVPESPGGPRIWAFAAITNNATQHVTAISPQ